MISVPCGYDICSAGDIRFAYEGNGYYIMLAKQVYHAAKAVNHIAKGDISLKSATNDDTILTKEGAFMSENKLFDLSMEKIMNINNLRRFAYCNDDIVKKPIKGIVIFFVGLGGCSMYNEGNETGNFFAEHGVLFVIPYHNPWAWMNRHTVDFTDEILDVLFETYDLPKDLPIVSSGGSMGGLSALVYTAHSKRTPSSCVASCPVCDLPYHFTERVDLPRTIYTAFASYEGSFEDALRTSSPIHLVDKMPKSTEYTIFHCEEDEAVNINKHSKPFVELMKKEHNITYYTVPGRGHCDLDEENDALYDRLLLEGAFKKPNCKL